MTFLKQWIQRFRDAPAARNIAKLTSGVLAGQALSFVLMPVFVRMYGDFVIGEWAFINAVAMILAFVADLGLINAIMMEKSEEEVRQTCRVVRSVLLLNCGVIMALSYTYFAYISPQSLTLPPLFSAGFLAFSVFCVQGVSIYYTLMTRAEQFTTLMKNPLIQNIAFGIAAVGLSVAGVTRYGYFIGWGIGQAAQLAHMMIQCSDNRFALRRADFGQVLARNRHYISMQMPANLLTQAKTELLPVIIKVFFGTAVLGQYSVTMRIIQIPANLVGTAIGRVFFSTASRLEREGRPLGAFARGNIDKSMKFAMIPVLFIVAFADVAMNWFLGPGWEMAGAFTRILAVQSFFLLLVYATQGLYIVLKKQSYAVITSIAQCVGAVISIAVGAAFHNIYIGLVAYTAMFAITQTIFFCALFRAMKLPAAGFCKSAALSMGAAMCAAFALRAVLMLFHAVPGW